MSAPAKINLGLRIVGRRPDGYHLLESLFVPLELRDELRIQVELGSRKASGVPVELMLHPDSEFGPDQIPVDASNLAVRGARAFLDAAAAAPVRAVRIELLKRIPAAAGLGGGSSDAAAVLRTLDELLPGALPQGERRGVPARGKGGARALARLALSLGADVPFFLSAMPAFVTGIGEELSPALGLPALDILLVNPGASIATADVYALHDEFGAGAASARSALTPEGPGPTLRALSGLGDDPGSLARLLACGNDLEVAAARICPSVAWFVERLRALGALGAGMSGSGATVWGVFPNADEARQALGALLEDEVGPPSWVRVTRSAAGGPG